MGDFFGRDRVNFGHKSGNVQNNSIKVLLKLHHNSKFSWNNSLNLKKTVSCTVRFCERNQNCVDEVTNAECPESADQLDYKNIAFFNENNWNWESRFWFNKF